MVAALFVEKGGVYWDLEGVDPWDEERDARLYAGPWPVVAHPPCSRWCQLAGLVQHRYPWHRKGEDGGCFASALASIRRWGGVLEHPAYSAAWRAFDLPAPPTGGGWIRGIDGGWSCYVEQNAYGHPARKATWLYGFGIDPPPLHWGRTNGAKAAVTWCMNRDWRGKDLPRIGKGVAAKTPLAFRDLLLSIARSAKQSRESAA